MLERQHIFVYANPMFVLYRDQMFRPPLNMQVTLAGLPDFLVPVKKDQYNLLFVISCLFKFFSSVSFNLSLL